MAVLTDESLYTQVSDLANAVEQTIEELADTLGMDKEQLTTLLQDSVKEPEEPVIVAEQESAAPVTDMQQESTGDQEVQTATISRQSSRVRQRETKTVICSSRCRICKSPQKICSRRRAVQ